MEQDPQLIGKGGYGCAFTPPLPCRKSKLRLKKNKKTRVVGKIMKEEDAEIELNISTVIKGIPGYERYFIISIRTRYIIKSLSKCRRF
jgi:hypothetical protein